MAKTPFDMVDNYLDDLKTIPKKPIKISSLQKFFIKNTQK